MKTLFPRMKTLFRQIHVWLSVPFGLIIALICFSGAALVFEKELDEYFRPDLYFVKHTEAEPLPVEELIKRVEAQLPDSVSVTDVNVSSDPCRAYLLKLSQPRRASVYVDPYTGEIKGKGGRTGFFQFMFRLHRWLLDSGNAGQEGIFWGKLVVGISTLLFVFVLISGVIVWFPRKWKLLKNSLKLSVNKGWRRFWYDLHVAGGVYALVLLLALALTGLTWSFPWYRTAFYNVCGVELQQAATHEEKPFLQPDKPNLQPDKPNLQPDKPNLQSDKTSLHSDKAAKVRKWIYSVHVGSWGGMPTRILTFLAALIGGILPLTGYYLWGKKLLNKRKRK